MLKKIKHQLRSQSFYQPLWCACHIVMGLGPFIDLLVWQLTNLHQRRDFIQILTLDTHSAGLHPGCSQDAIPNYISYEIKGKNHKSMYFLPLYNQGQAHILIHFLSMCNQSHFPSTCSQAHILSTSKLVCRAKIHSLYKTRQLQEQPQALWEVVCPWAKEARLDIFVL